MSTPDRFVNPYAFVPLPGAVVRRPWLGHLSSGGAERYTGTITATWTLKTRFLLLQNAVEEGWLGDDRVLRIPGSALKGAVRSLHEAMFNGCLRVVHEDYTPAYREPAHSFDQPQDWRLAIVTASEHGKPTEFQVTKAHSTEWVEARALQQAWPGRDLPASGDIVHIHGPRTDANLGRTEIRSVSSVGLVRRANDRSQACGAFPTGRIFLVTDTAARKVTRQDRSLANCFWATGELSHELVRFDPVREDAGAWAAFEDACRGSNDRRLLEQPGNPLNLTGENANWRINASYAPVSWPPQRPGSNDTSKQRARRTRQSGFLFRGDVVWVRYRGDGVEEIRLAQIWRKAGSGSVGDRIGDAGPCPREADGHHTVCLSCATFGSATTGERGKGERGRGEQSSYAGHVRFSSAVSKGTAETKEVVLAPMGSPNPGAGAFYLRLNASPPAQLAQDEIPSHWGVAEQGYRPIAGRKFYWHSDADEQAKHWSRENRVRGVPRYEDLGVRQSKMSRKARLVEPGLTIEATIGVDQLDQVGVDALLAALDPARLLHLTQHHRSNGPTYAVHLGGGKPFGLGSATVQLDVDLTSSRGRYAERQPSSTTWQDLGTEPGRARLRALLERAGSFGANLELLAVLLDLKGLGDYEVVVSYPPGASWREFGGQQFRQSYEFFQETNGQQLARSRREWLTLPQARPGQDPSLPIRTKRGSRR